MNQEPKGFNPHPYPYHYELELKISDISNLGVGIGRDSGWVIQVPFCWPGEKVRARIFKNHSNYSQADLVEIINPRPTGLLPNANFTGHAEGASIKVLATKPN